MSAYRNHRVCILDHGSDCKRNFNLIIWARQRYTQLSIWMQIKDNNVLELGGHVGMVFGWLIPCCFVMFVALSMAELASSMPWVTEKCRLGIGYIILSAFLCLRTSAGLYYFSAKLAPPKYSALASWITGWANITGQVTLVCGIDFTCAQMITTAIAVNTDGTVILSAGATFGILLAILLSHGIVCSAATSVLARLNLFYVVINGKFPIDLLSCLKLTANSGYIHCRDCGSTCTVRRPPCIDSWRLYSAWEPFRMG